MTVNTAPVKKFVRNHKTAITIVATATAVHMIHRIGLNQHDDFLKEHGLYETFYNPEG
jgi:hypothetical protein